MEYLKVKEAALTELNSAKVDDAIEQLSIVSFLPSMMTTKQLFMRRFAQWVAESSMPLSVSESYGFIEMMRVANKHLVVPDHKVVTDILVSKKVEASGKLKHYLWGLDRKYLFCCVTDTASNMNAFGISVLSWPNSPFIRHHYCADHVLQLTAVKAFSGEIQLTVPHVYGDHDNTVLAMKKARVLVNHFHSSYRAHEKLCNAQ